MSMQGAARNHSVERPRVRELLEGQAAEDRPRRRLGIDRDDPVTRSLELQRQPAAAAADLEHPGSGAAAGGRG